MHNQNTNTDQENKYQNLKKTESGLSVYLQDVLENETKENTKKNKQGYMEQDLSIQKSQTEQKDKIKTDNQVAEDKELKTEQNLTEQIREPEPKEIEQKQDKEELIKEPKTKIFSHSWQENLSRLEYKLRKIAKTSLPINFQNFKQPKLVLSSISNTAYSLKVFLLLSLVGFLVSTSFFGFSIYLLATIEAPATGGTLYEAVLGETFQRFNPVLNPSSASEEKITELLYHPLYRVTYPNFIKANDNPKIEPILLASPPEWVQNSESQNFTILKFELKKDLKWSDGTKLSTKDVAYTFERLKEKQANSQFQALLQDYQLITISDLKFEIRPVSGKTINPNPQLIYNLNFSPISADYYQNLSTQELINDLRSTTPEITSGFFTMPLKVENPFGVKKTDVDNPIRSNARAFTSVVLEKNPNQLNPIFLQRYVLTSYPSIEDGGGEDASSVQKSANEQKVDIFTRSGNLESSFDSSQVVKLTGLTPASIPTNTYYKMFFNLRVNNFFINQKLRKYVFCQMQNYNLPDRWSDQLSQIPPDKMSTPLHFGLSNQIDCQNARQELLDFRSSANSKPYTINQDTRNNITQVRLNGNPIRTTMVALTGTEPLARNIQVYLTSIGIETNLSIVNAGAEFEKVIRDGQYNLLFLPITMVNADPYPIFGTGGQNFNKISQNNRIGEESRRFGVGVEEDLKAYSQNNLIQDETKEKLVRFFNNEFVFANLLQVNQQVFISERIKNLLPSFGLQKENQNNTNLNFDAIENITFAGQIYHNLPFWYIQTKREFRL